MAAGKQIEADAANCQADEMKQIVAEKKEPRDKAAKALRKAEAAKKLLTIKLHRPTKDWRAQNPPRPSRIGKTRRPRPTKAAEEQPPKLRFWTETLQPPKTNCRRPSNKQRPSKPQGCRQSLRPDEAKRKTQPVSIFISLKTQKLYVRQGHEPVFEAPVTISEPDRPIGTHVYTAVEYTNDGKDLRWTRRNVGTQGGRLRLPTTIVSIRRATPKTPRRPISPKPPPRSTASPFQPDVLDARLRGGVAGHIAYRFRRADEQRNLKGDGLRRACSAPNLKAASRSGRSSSSATTTSIAIARRTSITATTDTDGGSIIRVRSRCSGGG